MKTHFENDELYNELCSVPSKNPKIDKLLQSTSPWEKTMKSELDFILEQIEAVDAQLRNLCQRRDQLQNNFDWKKFCLQNGFVSTCVKYKNLFGLNLKDAVNELTAKKVGHVRQLNELSFGSHFFYEDKEYVLKDYSVFGQFSAADLDGNLCDFGFNTLVFKKHGS